MPHCKQLTTLCALASRALSPPPDGSVAASSMSARRSKSGPSARPVRDWSRGRQQARGGRREPSSLRTRRARHEHRCRRVCGRGEAPRTGTALAAPGRGTAAHRPPCGPGCAQPPREQWLTGLGVRACWLPCAGAEPQARRARGRLGWFDPDSFERPARAPGRRGHPKGARKSAVCHTSPERPLCRTRAGPLRVGASAHGTTLRGPFACARRLPSGPLHLRSPWARRAAARL